MRSGARMAGVLGLWAAAAGAAEPAVRVSSGGLLVTAGDSQFQLGGRIQADAVWFAGNEAPLDDGTDVRRARLAVKGALDRDWTFKLEYDFADARTKDLFVTRRTSAGNLTVGQFSPPVSLEALATSKWILFLERALPVEGLLPDRELGLQYDTSTRTVWFAASLTGDNMDSDEPGDDRPTLMSRAVWAPRHATGDVLQFGASAGWVDASGGRASFGARPEARVDTTPRLVAATVTGARHHWLGALEAAYARGGLTLQAEYIGAAVEGAGGRHFDGGYLAVGWFVTGDAHTWDRTYFVLDRPAAERDSVELAARASRLDLRDAGAGAREDNLTLGLNYYPRPGLRFSANLIRARVEAAGGGDEFTVGALRAQLVF